ncbi:hypothetical protein B296_00042658 [Ensete ventricosum]|uniref:Uncharacterized protein n=1 Tax=Ensete ventricosum TaxID=4639 RepID=A0A426ZHR9_ENSVE|nr:hypothetical protein B296_00042658 [Ensete ventricosum]
MFTRLVCLGLPNLSSPKLYVSAYDSPMGLSQTLPQGQRKAKLRWESDDLAATAAEAALRLINRGWRTAPLCHFGRTDNDRPDVSTLPGMSAEVRTRV